MTQMFVRLLILAGVGVVVAGAILSIRRYFGSTNLPSNFDLRDASGKGPAALIEFTSPYCYECREALPLLKAASAVFDVPLTVIDAKDRPELASKYAIRHTPTILVVDSRGTVRGGWLGVPPEDELENALVSARRVVAA